MGGCVNKKKSNNNGLKVDAGPKDNRDGQNYDFRVLLIGDSSVGKSSLLLRYVDDTFTDSLMSTIGSDYKTKVVNVGKSTINLEIWDTAGQERFRTITSSFYRGADGILVVFDLTNQDSFDNIRGWLKDINKYAAEDVNRVLVGNKQDETSKRSVTTSEAKAFAEETDMPYVETSAKTGSNVDTAFLKLAEQILNKVSADV
eukprot:TRINITY_DN2928_c0_g1_i1.p1 TRINITY_DN2928_c0_g1~~TRINITY_DN2928_c0_g1_i1.p1  ORF type:complete len:201 (-),score=43.95 TRINITY_DN2928_c0_g1_i1:111-713(-)